MGAVIEDAYQTRAGWFGLAGYLAGFESIARGFGLVDRSASASQRKALSVAATYGAVSAGLGAFLIKSGVEAGKLDRLENSLSVVTGSAKAARDQMKSIEGTPASQLFGTDNVARAAVNLRNMGADADLTRLTITAMANATSAAAGDQTDFLAGTEAVARAIQTEHVGMRDLRAIMRASGPAFKLLADSMGLTVPQLENMEFRGLRARQVIQQLMEAENRVHGNAAQSDLGTLEGQLQRIQHRAQDAGRAIGDSVKNPLRDTVKFGADLLDMFDRAPGAVHSGAAYGAAGVSALLGVRALTSLAGFMSRLPLLAGVAARLAPLAGLLRSATPYGLVSLGGEFASGFIPDRRMRGLAQGGFAGLGVGALVGGGIGALIGGRAGPAGLAGGAALGAYLGILAASMQQDAARRGGVSRPGAGAAATDPHLTALQKIEQHLAQMRSDVATMVRGEVFDTANVPGAFQALAAMHIAGMMR